MVVYVHFFPFDVAALTVFFAAAVPVFGETERFYGPFFADAAEMAATGPFLGYALLVPLGEALGDTFTFFLGFAYWVLISSRCSKNFFSSSISAEKILEASYYPFLRSSTLEWIVRSVRKSPALVTSTEMTEGYSMPCSS